MPNLTSRHMSCIPQISNVVSYPMGQNLSTLMYCIPRQRQRVTPSMFLTQHVNAAPPMPLNTTWLPTPPFLLTPHFLPLRLLTNHGSLIIATRYGTKRACHQLKGMAS